jgi:hypothetical protein
METSSSWYENISQEILAAKAKLEKNQIKKYSPEMLLHCARKVALFAPACRTCLRYQGDIRKMTDYLNRASRLTADEEKDYLKKGNIIGNHLQAQHKLNLEGKYFGWGAVAGAALGAITGWASGLLFIALPVGLVIGCLIGWIFEKKARDNGKTL